MASRVTTLILFTLSLLAFGDSESLHLRRDNWVVRSPLTYNPGTRSLGLDITSLTALLPASGISSLNGLTGATQTFATPGTTGTAPNWSSSGTAHTLNIPMAATSSVTAGLISKTQYDTFNGKQAALSTGTSNQWIRSDDLAPHALASADIPNNAANTSGNAATATALAANPTDCAAGNFATTIDTSGNLTCSTAVTSVAQSVPQHLTVSGSPISGAGTLAITAKAIYDAGNSSTAITLDFNNGAFQKVTLTGNCTFTLSNPVSGEHYTLIVYQDATGGRTLAWPGTMKWENAITPTMTVAASKADVYRFVWDGTNYFVYAIGQNF